MTRKTAIYLFILFLTTFSFQEVLNTQFKLINYQIMMLIQFICVLLMIVSSKKIIKASAFESTYFKFFAYLLFSYLIIIILRGIKLDFDNLKLLICTDYLFWPFIIPVFIFFDLEDLSFFYLIKAFYILGIFFLIFSIADPYLLTHRATAEQFIFSFAFTCGFLLFNTKYTSKKITLLAFISLSVALISFIYLGRRNAIVSFGGQLLVGLYFVLRNIKFAKYVKLIPLMSGLIILILLFFDYIPASLTSRLNERLNEDTRSDVFDNLFKSMEDDMYFGKGMNGTYYSPIEAQILDDGAQFQEETDRTVIENGYLQLLLNGGYLYIAIFLLLLLPAAFIGIFKSKNQLSQAAGAIIILWLLDMAIYGLPRLLMQYILVWICVSICYKKTFRNKTDEEISESFLSVGLSLK